MKKNNLKKFHGVNLITLIKFMLLASAVISMTYKLYEQAGLSVKEDDALSDSAQIKGLFASRLLIDGSAEEAQLGCDKLTETVEELVRRLPRTARMIRSVLETPGFQVICASVARIESLVPLVPLALVVSHDNPTAFFNRDKKAIYFSEEQLSPALLSNEFAYASSHFRHQTKSCFESNYDLSAFPHLSCYWRKPAAIC